MNTIFKRLFLVLLATFVAQGCSEDAIDLYPEFTLDAISNPSTLEQVEQVLLGAYARFRDANYYGSGSGTGAGWAMMPDVMSDNIYETTKESLANSRTMAEWAYQSDLAQIMSFYIAPYQAIAAANIVIRDADKFATATNGTMINRLKGQAHAIRALAHFDLFRYFATTFDRNSNDLALYYNKEFVVSTEVKPSRITNTEYYTELFGDLTQAVTLLGNVDKTINTAATTRPFIDLAVVYALQARVFLYAGEWADAETAATNAMALANPLVNLDQEAYSGMYNETDIGEIIWNVQFNAGESGPTYLVYFATSDRNYYQPAYDIAVETGDAGLIQSNDIRFDAFFKPANSNVEGLSVKKYQGKSTLTDGNANFVAFKTGELYLIRAEARARNSKEGLALDDLNALRATRITGYVNEAGLTGAALLDAIADERRRELFCEGHRFFDLKRTTRTIQRGAPWGDTQVAVGGVYELAPTDREWALPIPESVRNANENMDQNPDY